GLPPEGDTKGEVLLGCPSVNRGSGESGVRISNPTLPFDIRDCPTYASLEVPYREPQQKLPTRKVCHAGASQLETQSYYYQAEQFYLHMVAQLETEAEFVSSNLASQSFVFVLDVFRILDCRLSSGVTTPFRCQTVMPPEGLSFLREHESWDTVRLPEPRQDKSSHGGRVRTSDLPAKNLPKSGIELLSSNDQRNENNKRFRAISMIFSPKCDPN
ncbi:hypothetical protein T265_13939, partial [Opisthorchis viverrini]